jgi:hypothetical protein
VPSAGLQRIVDAVERHSRNDDLRFRREPVLQLGKRRITRGQSEAEAIAVNDQVDEVRATVTDWIVGIGRPLRANTGRSSMVAERAWGSTHHRLLAFGDRVEIAHDYSDREAEAEGLDCLERPHAPTMSRGDGRNDPADRLPPPQAAGMSCYSVAEEITSICADFLVVDAVSPNWSPQPNSLFIREIARYSLFFEQFEDRRAAKNVTKRRLWNWSRRNGIGNLLIGFREICAGEQGSLE